MNIPSRLNNFHSFYGKAKYAFLTVFALTIIFSVSMSHSVYGYSVVGTVETKLTLKIDGKTRDIKTTQNTVGGALIQNEVALEKFDITEPPLDTYLSGKTLDVQIIRAVPVLITDNGQSWPATTAYTQPTDILKQLEVEVFPEDLVSAELIMDPATEGAVGQKIIIQRAPAYTIYVDDTAKIVRSWGANVGDLLIEKGITVGINDIVEPNKEMPLEDVLDVTIIRINFADVEETVPIEYASVSQTSYDLYKGQSKVTQDGINGSKKQSLHIVYHNGIEVSRDVIAVTVLSEPQTKITLVGTKPYNAGAWWDTLVAAGSRWGVDPSAMFSVMTCESGGNPYAGNYYKGLFQYSPDTWYGASAAYPGGQFSGAAITDGNAQIWVTAWKVNHDGGWRAWGCKP